MVDSVVDRVDSLGRWRTGIKTPTRSLYFYKTIIKQSLNLATDGNLGKPRGQGRCANAQRLDSRHAHNCKLHFKKKDYLHIYYVVCYEKYTFKIHKIN